MGLSKETSSREENCPTSYDRLRYLYHAIHYHPIPMSTEKKGEKNRHLIGPRILFCGRVCVCLKPVLT